MFGHLKLGCRPFSPSPKDLRFRAYLPPRIDQIIEAAMAPGSINWHRIPNVNGEMPTPNEDPLNNDIHGNCVYAAMANGAMQVAQRVGRPRIITGAEVDAAYAEGTGFDPVTGDNDDGALPRCALTDWTRKDIFGTRCLAHCLVDPNDYEEVLLAMFLGGWLLAAYDLPLSAHDQRDDAGNPNWFIDPTRTAGDNEKRGWGGHAVCEHAVGMRQNTTWGMHGHATEPWCKRYVSSLHLAFLLDWEMAKGVAPNGFAIEDLLSDARARGAVVG